MLATGQMWKLAIGTVAYFAALFLFAWGVLRGPDFQFIAAGLLTFALGVMFCSIAIRCPKCGARWYWTALRHYQPRFVSRLLLQSRCPSCDYSEGSNDA